MSRGTAAIILSFVWCFLMTVPTTLGGDVYLDATASGARNGISWLDAYVSVSQAVANVKSGDTLWINSGSYGGAIHIEKRSNVSIRVKSGMATPAVFANAHFYDDDNLLIDGLVNDLPMLKFTQVDPVYHHVFNLRQTTLASIRGVWLDRGTACTNDTRQEHGFRIWDQTGDVLVEKCWISNTSGDGINVSQIIAPLSGREYDWVTVRSNTIWNVGDDGCQCALGNITFDGNTVDNNGFPTFFGGHPDGFQLNPDRSYARVINNTFRGFNQNIFIEYAVSNIVMYNNILIGLRTNSTDRGMNISVRTNFTGDWVLANNTFYYFISYAGVNGEITPAIRNPGARCMIGNNIFVDCKIMALGCSNILDESNVYWDTGQSFYDTSGNRVALPSNRYIGGARNIDPGLIAPSFDSVFVAGSGGNFRLSQDSAAIDRGRSFGAVFQTDKMGRIREGQWDLGAIEADYSKKPVRPARLRVLPPTP